MDIGFLQYVNPPNATLPIYFSLIISDWEGDLKKHEVIGMQHICKKDTSLISAMVSFMGVNMFFQMKTWELKELGIWHNYLTVIKCEIKSSQSRKLSWVLGKKLT